MDDKNSNTKKVHIWRMCPIGQHWVVRHPMHVPPSQTHPEGYVTTRSEHCAHNPSGKDQFYPDEINEIAKKFFQNLKTKPCSLGLGFPDFKENYDDLIAGWTQYWNEVLNPKIPLEPNIVKALIASESRFIPTLLANNRNSDSARGHMQITIESRKILGDEKGEIHDHYLTVTKSDLNNPNINICAGIRWLFQKQKLASSFLNREATWEEAVHNYKSILKKKDTAKDKIKIKGIFDKLLERLIKCGA